jgi:hypothetical protein
MDRRPARGLSTPPGRGDQGVARLPEGPPAWPSDNRAARAAPVLGWRGRP